jgi:hypothetical protein
MGSGKGVPLILGFIRVYPHFLYKKWNFMGHTNFQTRPCDWMRFDKVETATVCIFTIEYAGF